MPKIFCLPFAGGNRYSYRILEKAAPPTLPLIPLEYPGRGARMGEPFAQDIDELVDDLYGQVKNKIGQGDYALYGHSMGALAAWLLAGKLIRHGHIPPMHLFVTGTEGPAALYKDDTNRHLLGKDAFREELKRLNGCPAGLFENPELFELMEPILRADFKVLEEYKYVRNPPLDMPFTVITGREEDIATEDIRCWEKESAYAVDFHVLPGDHFFIFDQAKALIGLMAKKMAVTSKAYDRP